jgi:hypothetical protein
MNESRRGKPLNAVLAASSSTSAVAICTYAYKTPEPKLWWASWESAVWPARGTMPSRRISTTSPANIATSRQTIAVSTVRALRTTGSLKAGTALEIASIPVIAVAPEENARSASNSVAVSTG